jgi:parallel beta-helix repeat protein
LNDFINNSKGVISYLTNDIKLYSPTPITYTYNGKTYTNYLGNYYSDYNGTDSDEDGIGDTPYGGDNYPLVKPVENYKIESETTPIINAKYINSLPYTITESGYYILNISKPYLNALWGIKIQANNVVLDGNGNIIGGSGEGNGIDAGNVNNITIKNINLNLWYDGIHFVSVTNSSAYNINISNCGGNGFGIYYSSNNKITNVKVSGCNNDAGFDFWASSNNAITNSITTNNKYGIYLDNSSNYNSITSTIISSNSYGIYVRGSDNNIIYLNDLNGNTNENIKIESGNNNRFYSPNKITYSYNNEKTFTNYLGNHYSDYTGNDSNGDGIGDTPYNNIDSYSYPLIESFNNYKIVSLTKRYITTLPYTINESGYYVLNTSYKDWNIDWGSSAITINADNVVLDGNGNVLDGNGNYCGIYEFSSGSGFGATKNTFHAL